MSIGHSQQVPSCKISHTHLTKTKIGHSFIFFDIAPVLPFPLASSFAMPFASRKTWRGLMIHSWLSGVLQSKIKIESSDARTPYVVSQLRRIWESISRFNVTITIWHNLTFMWSFITKYLNNNNNIPITTQLSKFSKNLKGV